MLSQKYAPTAGKQGFQKSLRLGTNDFWHSKNECNRLKNPRNFGFSTRS